MKESKKRRKLLSNENMEHIVFDSTRDNNGNGIKASDLIDILDELD